MRTMEPRGVLQQVFGFADFRPGQEESIQQILAGRDTLVVMPTGAGKSLIYQVAALCLPGLTLVISPLISLMKDQADSMQQRSIPATFINSSLDPYEQSSRLAGLEQGKYKVLLVSPERLRSQSFGRSLQNLPISLLVVDEAHCISHWGHDFRPDYLHVIEARELCRMPTALAMTATATPKVQDDVIRKLAMKEAKRIITGFNRSNLIFEVVYSATEPAKQTFLQSLFAGNPGPGIIYAGTRKTAQKLAKWISDSLGQTVPYYHAGLDSASRTQIQDAFLLGQLPWVVATNAFGMGIDRPDLRFVLHYNLPSSLEAYYQEAGRAGRDGQKARAILLYAPEDRSLQEYLIEFGSPAPNDIRLAYDHFRANPTTTTDDLLLETELQPVKARVTMELLEAAGLQKINQPEFGRLEVKTLLPLTPERLHQVADQAEGRRQQRLQRLEEMVRYGESNGCRRKILLSHFGDNGEPMNQFGCCDNCGQSASATAQLDPATREILSLARLLDGRVGRTKIAQILNGSLARDMQGFKKHPGYGRLSHFSQDQTIKKIDWLVENSFLKLVGGRYPTVRITPKGKAWLLRPQALAQPETSPSTRMNN